MEVSSQGFSSQALAAGWLQCPFLTYTFILSQKWQRLGFVPILMDLPEPLSITLMAACELF